jgi:hypothetical protein
MLTGTVEELLVGVGRAFVTMAITAPDVDPFALLPDRDTVMLGDDWGTITVGSNSYIWTYLGYTQNGLRTRHGQNTTNVPVDQQTTSPLTIVTETTDEILLDFAQGTLDNIKRAIGRGALTTLASTTTERGYKRLRLSSDATITTIALGFEGVAPPTDGGQPRRIIFPKVRATGTVEFNQNPRGIAVAAAELSRYGGAEADPVYEDVLALSAA